MHSTKQIKQIPDIWTKTKKEPQPKNNRKKQNQKDNNQKSMK